MKTECKFKVGDIIVVNDEYCHNALVVIDIKFDKCNQVWWLVTKRYCGKGEDINSPITYQERQAYTSKTVEEYGKLQYKIVSQMESMLEDLRFEKLSSVLNRFIPNGEETSLTLNGEEDYGRALKHLRDLKGQIEYEIEENKPFKPQQWLNSLHDVVFEND